MPVGYVPNPEELTRAIAKTKRLSIVHSERFGPHYGKTMRRWRENVLANREVIERSYSADHVRVYDYVFGMAAACFTSGTFDLLQLVVQNEPVTNHASVYDPRSGVEASANFAPTVHKRRAAAG